MISFASIHKQYGKQLIFVDASFQLNPGEKVGLVGPNGSGKTTLFRMVVGEETPDEGEVSVAKKLTIGYFRQDVEMQGRSVLDEAIDWRGWAGYPVQSSRPRIAVAQGTEKRAARSNQDRIHEIAAANPLDQPKRLVAS